LDRLGVDFTYGQISDQEGVLGLVWSDVLGETPGGDVRFGAFSAHYAPTDR